MNKQRRPRDIVELRPLALAVILQALRDAGMVLPPPPIPLGKDAGYAKQRDAASAYSKWNNLRIDRDTARSFLRGDDGDDGFELWCSLAELNHGVLKRRLQAVTDWDAFGVRLRELETAIEQDPSAFTNEVW